MDRWFPKRKQLNEIMVNLSPAQAMEVQLAYDDRYEHTLDEAFSKCAGSRDHADALCALTTEPSVFFARRLRKAFKGLGTDESAVVRIISGSGKDGCPLIAAAYEAEFGKPLVNALKSEISGDFLKACLQWLEGV